MSIKSFNAGIFLIFLMICFSGCTEQQNDVIGNNEPQNEVIEGTGTIVFNETEGGFFGIISDESLLNYSTNHLIPVELLPDFKKDGLKVWFEVHLRPDLGNNTWGIKVEILGIEKI